MRSEGNLKGMPERKVRHLRSMGQLVSFPDGPPPPLPLRSPLRPVIQFHSIDSMVAPNDSAAVLHQSSTSDCGSDRSDHSQDLSSDGSTPCNTMLVHGCTDQDKVEFQLRDDPERRPSLHDLGRLLEVSSHLKELGTTFTRNGEMQTYGNPHSSTFLEQMLQLGAEYDELWHAFFIGRSRESENEFGPVLQVLEKMLQNEGVQFDDHHARLNYGSALPKLIRLGDRYDSLRLEWLEETLRNIHPALRWDQAPEREEVPKAPVAIGWSFTKDEHESNELTSKKTRRAKRLMIVAEKQPSMQNGLRPVNQESTAPFPTLLGPPGVAVNASGSMSIPTDTPAIVRPHGLRRGAVEPVHGSSPLQRVNTAGVLLVDNALGTQAATAVSNGSRVPYSARPLQHEQAGVLGRSAEEERRCAEDRQDTVEEKTLRKEGKKSNGVRYWFRSILGLKKDGR